MWIHPVDFEILNPVIQCLVDLLQCAITEFVYLVEAHHHLNPIFVLKHDSPKRIDDGVVMLVLKTRGIPLRFGEVQLSLVTLNPKLEVFYALSDNQVSGPLVDGRSENLLVFRWEELMAFFHFVLKNHSINVAMSLVCVSNESLGGGEYLDARVDAQLFVRTGTSDDRIEQVGSGVAGRSSSKGFHQSCLMFTLGIWALPMSSSSNDYACSSGPISSSISRSTGVNEIDGLSLMSVIVQA
nr:hypothetical protein [Tanacetum cinerariifolium]